MINNIVSELDEIIATKRYLLEQRKAKTPIEAIRALASMQTRPAPFLNTVNPPDMVEVIGQICYLPPPSDNMEFNYDPVATAVNYAHAGVNAISIFTDDVPHSNGSDDLMYVAQAVKGFELPVLSQDYILDEYQVVEARAAGAAGLALDARVVSLATLQNLVSLTQRNRMTALVYAETQAQLEFAVSLSPQAIAVSKPDDPETLALYRSLIPSHIRMVIMGGLRTIDDVMEVVAAGVNAILLSPQMMQQDWPELHHALYHPRA